LSGYTTVFSAITPSTGDSNGGDVTIQSGNASGPGTDGNIIIDVRETGGLILEQEPPNNDALIQVLVRDESTGAVHYRSASSLGGSGGGISDGNKGAITVSSSGSAWSVNN